MEADSSVRVVELLNISWDVVELSEARRNNNYLEIMSCSKKAKLTE